MRDSRRQVVGDLRQQAEEGGAVLVMGGAVVDEVKQKERKMRRVVPERKE